MKHVSAHESVNCHIKSRNLENSYWISKYVVKIS